MVLLPCEQLDRRKAVVTIDLKCCVVSEDARPSRGTEAFQTPRRTMICPLSVYRTALEILVVVWMDCRATPEGLPYLFSRNAACGVERWLRAVLALPCKN